MHHSFNPRGTWRLPWWYLTLMLLLVLIGCGSEAGQGTVLRPTSVEPKHLVYPTSVPKTPQPLTDDFQERWLAGTPCAPPCWEGVTPGVTRLSEAVPLLNGHPMITDLLVYRAFGKHDSIDWYFIDAFGSGGSMALEPAGDNPLITSIDVAFPHAFPLQAIRAAYGDPDYVMPSVILSPPVPHGGGGGSFIYELQFIYLRHGFLIATEPNTFNSPLITSTMHLSRRVIFFPPTPAGFDALSVGIRGVGTLADAIPWQGLHDFEFYCGQVRPMPDTQQLCPNPSR